MIPEIKIISHFFENEGYINTIIERAKKYNINDYDHILFSYHGLPERQVDKVYVDGKPCTDHNCEDEVKRREFLLLQSGVLRNNTIDSSKIKYCKRKYTVCFQSRLDKKWLTPFSDVVVKEQAKKGAKKILAFSPAFVADCLETIVEIGSEYQQIFKENGGEKIQLVESLNDHPMWMQTLKEFSFETSLES